MNLDKKSIVIISEMPCQLKCNFCLSGNGYKIKREVFELDKFKSLVDTLILNDFKQVDLTPTVGDIFLDINIYDKMKYLNEVGLYFEYVTNILAIADNKIYDVCSYKESEFAISIYGWDDTSYKNITNTDNFNLFLEKLMLINDISYPDSSNIRLYMRCCDIKDMPSGIVKQTLISLISKGATVEDAELTNKNWGGRLDYGPKQNKKGLCNRFLYENGIYPNGDITLCNCWDWDREFIIGNIYDTELSDIYNLNKNEKLHTLIKSHILGQYCGICKNCNDFYETTDVSQYDFIKKYKRII